MGSVQERHAREVDLMCGRKVLRVDMLSSPHYHPMLQMTTRDAVYVLVTQEGHDYWCVIPAAFPCDGSSAPSFYSNLVNNNSEAGVLHDWLVTKRYDVDFSTSAFISFAEPRGTFKRLVSRATRAVLGAADYLRYPTNPSSLALSDDQRNELALACSLEASIDWEFVYSLPLRGSRLPRSVVEQHYLTGAFGAKEKK